MRSTARLAPLVALCLLFSTLAFAQEKAATKESSKATSQSPGPSQVAPATPKPPLAFGLAEDTPVKIKLARTMSSADAKAGDKVDFEVLEDVKIGDVIVVQHGAMAIGTVTEAHPKRRMGRAGN